MSSIAYGALVRARQRAGTAAGETVTEKTGIGVYVDALAALVPAEVLAAEAAILAFTTGPAKSATTTPLGGFTPLARSSVARGAVVTEPTALKVAFYGLIVLSVVFYAAGLRQFAKPHWHAIVGGLLPPIAFVAWTMIQRTTAFDAIAPGMSYALREVIGILAALVLPLIAGALAVRINNSPASAPKGGGSTKAS